MSITDEADNETTGAIDTSDDQPSPPISTDNSQGQPPAQGQTPAPNQLPDVGAPPAMNELATETTGQLGSDIGEGFKSDVGQGVQNVQQSGPGQLAKRVIAYLGGEGGNPAGALRGAEAVKQVAPHLSDGDAALISIDNTAKTKGVQAAFDELQGHRIAYNAKLAFAKVAAEGIGGKPANIASAVDAANKAMMHMPDGANVHFQAGQGGVTATVKMPGTSQVHQIPLSIDQFKQFLDVGGAGQWDRVHGQGTPVALQSLARSQGAQPRGAQPQPQQGGGETYDQMRARAPDSEAVRTGQPQAMDVTQADQPAIPGTHDEHGRYIGPKRPEAPTNYGDELEARARARFPYGDETTRGAYKDEQEEKELERQNKIDVGGVKAASAENVARITGTGRQGVATINAGAKVEAAKTYSQAHIEQGRQKLQAAIAAEEGKRGRTAETNAMRGLDALVASGQLNKMSPQQKAYWDRLTTLPQAPAPQAPTPQAAAPTGQAQPSARARFADGKYYVKGPDGKAKLDPNQNP